jgi:hypothetical protein
MQPMARSLRSSRLHFMLAFAVAAGALISPLARGAVLPITEEQRARWSKPRPEPVTLDLKGWSKTSTVKNPAEHDSLPNRDATTFQNRACNVRLIRDWDMPLDPGFPATIEGSRPVTVAGRPAKLLTVNQFGPGKFQSVGIAGKGYDVEYQVMIRFQNCPDDVIDDVLSHVEVHW